MTRQPKSRPRTAEAEHPAPSEPFVEFVSRVLHEKRAESVVRLDVRGVTDIADEFLIATIRNPRQGAAIVEECEKERKRREVPCLGIEGRGGASWVLLDYGDLIVHLLMPEQRAYYDLEHIWADAKRVE